MKIGEGKTGEASDSDDLRTTGTLVFKLSYPRVNETNQHNHQHTHMRIHTNLHMIAGLSMIKIQKRRLRGSVNNRNKGKETERNSKDCT